MVEVVAPGRSVTGEVNLPSSKSLSNRHLILNHLVGNKATIHHLSAAEDTRLLQDALNKIKYGNDQIIDVGHAGTDFRFLTALLAFTEGAFTLTGSSRLQERPIKGLVDGLRQLNADIIYLKKEGYPPLKINGKKSKGGSVEMDASTSSQFISALMLASPLLEGELKINLTSKSVSTPYMEMTIHVLEQYGIMVQVNNDRYRLKGSLKIPDHSIEIEGDWTSASYFYSICALSEESSLLLKGLSKNSLQGDSVLADIYSSFGVKTTFLENSVRLDSIKSNNQPFVYDFTNCPDLAQTLAVTCAALGKPAYLVGLETLRIKETDRITALAAELEKMGAKVKVTRSSLSLEGIKLSSNPTQTIKTYNDHRMAMSFAPLALVAKNIKIEDPDVVVKSYPHFWDDLRSLGFSVNLHP